MRLVRDDVNRDAVARHVDELVVVLSPLLAREQGTVILDAFAERGERRLGTRGKLLEFLDVVHLLDLPCRAHKTRFCKQLVAAFQ